MYLLVLVFYNGQSEFKSSPGVFHNSKSWYDTYQRIRRNFALNFASSHSPHFLHPPSFSLYASDIANYRYLVPLSLQWHAKNSCGTWLFFAHCQTFLLLRKLNENHKLSLPLDMESPIEPTGINCTVLALFDISTLRCTAS